jgi:hypothetical protein
MSATMFKRLAPFILAPALIAAHCARPGKSVVEGFGRAFVAKPIS